MKVEFVICGNCGTAWDGVGVCPKCIALVRSAQLVQAVTRARTTEAAGEHPARAHVLESVVGRVLGNMLEFFSLLDAERLQQYLKHGDNNLHPDTYIRIIGEEFGEVCRAIDNRDQQNLEEELIQVAASCARMWQALKRGGVEL